MRAPQVILDNVCRRGPWSKRGIPFGQNFLDAPDGISIVFARLEVSSCRAAGKSLKQTRLSTSIGRPMALRRRQKGDAASLAHDNRHRNTQVTGHCYVLATDSMFAC